MMGKWKPRNELQEYFDKIREEQDRQYVKGRGFGKASFYDFKKAYKRDAVSFLLDGFILMMIPVGFLLLILINRVDIFDYIPGAAWLLLGLCVFLGGLCILAGVKVGRRAKK